MVEVQCSSCHTRYRVDERVLPEGTPTFKCSRCGHVFTIEPRRDHAAPPPKPRPAPRARAISDEAAGAEPKEPPPRLDPPSTPERPQVQASPFEALDIAEPPSPVQAIDRLQAQAPERPRPAPAPPKTTRPKISTAELLSRPLPKAPDVAEGENLAFDFSREGDALEDDSAAALAAANSHERAVDRTAPRWTVGADARADEFEINNDGFEIEEPPPHPAVNRPQSAPVQPHRRTNRDGFVDESEAPVYNAGVSHSARFFLGLLLLALIGFVATTISIHSAPATARSLLNHLPVVGDRFDSPITPARMVVLHDVHSAYQRGKDGRSLLVIDGQAQNVTAAPLHTVGIAAALEIAPGKPLARREVYCGNNLATRTIAEMTPHEIDFFQSLPPSTTFQVDASASCPFVIVFTQPVAAAGHFALVITRAETARAPSAGSNS